MLHWRHEIPRSCADASASAGANPIPASLGSSLVVAALALATGVGSAAVGGVYLAFSTMVMPALRRRPAAEAAAAMQAINVRAERGPFIVAFAVTTLLAGALGVTSATRVYEEGGAESGALLELGASVLSLASTAITIVGNVPRNNRLAREGVAAWAGYDRGWTRINSVRALLALGAVALLLAR